MNAEGRISIEPAEGELRQVAPPLVTPGYAIGFALVVSLFFIWAVGNNLNDVLVRQFQKALALSRAQAGLIQFIFYIGYFTVALPAGALVRRRGYRFAILTGLLLYAVGALLFYPAAEARSYGAFLLALFIIAAGSATLETAANPYVLAFGDPARAPQRLSFAHAFNGLGSVVSPILGGLLIFSGVEHGASALARMSDVQREAYRISESRAIETPYIGLALFVLAVAIAFAFVPLPSRTAPADATGAERGTLLGLLKVASLKRAVIAQFLYIGTQVCVWSFFIDFVKEVSPVTPERMAAYLLSGSFFLFTVGRLLGALLMARIPAVALLLMCGCINIILCAVAMTGAGTVAIVALTLTSLFSSIMFPTIFSLGLRDLGARAPLGASLIVMSIVGGAVLPPLMGLLSQLMGQVAGSLIIPAAGFALITLYAADQRRATT